MINAKTITQLTDSLDLALTQELPTLKRVREQLKTHLEVHDFVPSPPGTVLIATVATDGGENQLRLDPIRLHLFRVADSAGKQYFPGFIPLSLTPEQIIEAYFKNIDVLDRFHQRLGTSPSDFLPKSTENRGPLMALLRELLEWAAVLDLLDTPGGPRRVVIRDGLLRSVALPTELFSRLKDRLQQACAEHQHLLVGVAKRSGVLNYLALAFGMDQLIPAGRRGWVAIPENLEQQAAPATYNWIGPRSMGDLILARLTASSGLLYACDLPRWHDSDERAAILGALAADSQSGFPSTGYPLSLTQAHNHAHIGGFEIEFLERLLMERLNLRDPALAREVALQQMLGRRLTLPEEAPGA